MVVFTTNLSVDTSTRVYGIPFGTHRGRLSLWIDMASSVGFLSLSWQHCINAVILLLGETFTGHHSSTAHLYGTLRWTPSTELSVDILIIDYANLASCGLDLSCIVVHYDFFRLWICGSLHWGHLPEYALAYQAYHAHAVETCHQLIS